MAALLRAAHSGASSNAFKYEPVPLKLGDNKRSTLPDGNQKEDVSAMVGIRPNLPSRDLQPLRANENRSSRELINATNLESLNFLPEHIGCLHFVRVLAIVFGAVGVLAICFEAPWLGLPCLNRSHLQCYESCSPVARTSLHTEEQSHGAQGQDNSHASCSEIALSDKANGTQARHCLDYCEQAVGHAYLAPHCFMLYVDSLVCLKAQTRLIASMLPRSYFFALAICYTAAAWLWASSTPVHDNELAWRWALEADHGLPWKWVFSRPHSEKDVAVANLWIIFFMKVLDHFSAINTLAEYLCNAQPIYAIVHLLSYVVLSTDLFRTKELVEWRRSVSRGYVPTREFIEIQAADAISKAPLTVLIPANAILFPDTLEPYTLMTLLTSMSVSLWSVYSSDMLELVGAMAGNENMPYGAQQKQADASIKFLRCFEVLSLIPASLALQAWGILLVYVAGLIVCSTVHTMYFMASLILSCSRAAIPFSMARVLMLLPPVMASPGGPLMGLKGSLAYERPCLHEDSFPFQMMNPQAFGLLSVIVGAALWPCALTWPGSFTDPAAHCSMRSWRLQVFLPCMPTRCFYAARFCVSIAFWALAMAPYFGIDTVSFFTTWRPHTLPLPHTELSCLLFAQASLILAGLLSPFAMVALLFCSNLLKVLDSDVAIRERAAQLLTLSETWQCLATHDLAEVLSIIALADCRMQKISKALPMLQRAFDSLDTNSPHKVKLLRALGHVHCKMSNHEGLVELERALRMQEKIYGLRHMEVCRTCRFLGWALLDFGNPKEATPYLERALHLLSDTPVTNPDLARTKRLLGWSLLDSGNQSHAAEVLEDALRLQRMALGPHHPEIGHGLSKLAKAYNANGRHLEALALLEEELDLAEYHFGPESTDIACCSYELAVTCVHLERYREAIGYFEKSLHLAQLGKVHVHRKIIGSAWIGLAQAQQREAVRSLKQGTFILQEVVGDSHPDLVLARKRLELASAQDD